jgi:hypothetical protein
VPGNGGHNSSRSLLLSDEDLGLGLGLAGLSLSPRMSEFLFFWRHAFFFLCGFFIFLACLFFIGGLFFIRTPRFSASTAVRWFATVPGYSSNFFLYLFLFYLPPPEKNVDNRTSLSVLSLLFLSPSLFFAFPPLFAFFPFPYYFRAICFDCLFRVLPARFLVLFPSIDAGLLLRPPGLIFFLYPFLFSFRFVSFLPTPPFASSLSAAPIFRPSSILFLLLFLSSFHRSTIPNPIQY